MKSIALGLSLVGTMTSALDADGLGLDADTLEALGFAAEEEEQDASLASNLVGDTIDNLLIYGEASASAAAVEELNDMVDDDGELTFEMRRPEPQPSFSRRVKISQDQVEMAKERVGGVTSQSTIFHKCDFEKGDITFLECLNGSKKDFAFKAFHACQSMKPKKLEILTKQAKACKDLHLAKQKMAHEIKLKKIEAARQLAKLRESGLNERTKMQLQNAIKITAMKIKAQVSNQKHTLEMQRLKMLTLKQEAALDEKFDEANAKLELALNRNADLRKEHNKLQQAVEVPTKYNSKKIRLNANEVAELQQELENASRQISNLKSTVASIVKSVGDGVIHTVPAGGKIWDNKLITLSNSNPVHVTYDFMATKRNSEVIGAFSLNKKPWSGGRVEDAVSWYVAPHRKDFTFRTKMFGGWPRVTSSNARTVTPFEWHKMSLTFLRNKVSYSIDGSHFATTELSNSDIPAQGYMGMISWNTEWKWRNLLIN